MCSLVGSSCAEGSRRTTSTTTPKCGPTIEEQGQLAGGCARSGRSVYGWVENTLLSMQTRARAHALSTSYELLLLVERLDVHRDGSLSTTRLSKIKKRERRVSKTKSYLHALLLGRVGNVTIFPLQITSPPRSQPAVVLRDAGACLLMSRAIV